MSISLTRLRVSWGYRQCLFDSLSVLSAQHNAGIQEMFVLASVEVFSFTISSRVETSGRESMFLIWHQDQMRVSPTLSHSVVRTFPSVRVSDTVSPASGQEPPAGWLGLTYEYHSCQPPFLGSGLSITSLSRLDLVGPSRGSSPTLCQPTPSSPSCSELISDFNVCWDSLDSSPSPLPG